MDYIIANKEWILSGVGVTIIAALLRWVLKNRKKKKGDVVLEQKMKVSGNGMGIQAGGNVEIKK